MSLFIGTDDSSSALQRIATGVFPTGDFTAMGWVRNLTTGAAAADKLIWEMTDTVTFDFYFYVAVGAGGFGVYGFYHNNNIDGDIDTGPVSIAPLNEWHHWSLTYNTTTHDIVLYSDGRIVDSSNME